MGFKGGAAHGLTGLRAADGDDSPPRRLHPEQRIEADDALHLGAGEVQPLGDDRNASRGQEPELVLNRVQDGQQRPLKGGQALDDFPCCIRECATVHGSLPKSLSLLERQTNAESS